MKYPTRVFGLMSDLLSYPKTCYREHLQELVPEVESSPELARRLAPFSSFVDESNLSQIEELFTKTFDLNPTTCLEVGWHLYGEDYKRGEFLVRMRQALTQFRLPESVELPDHMSHCLRLLERIDQEDGRAFAVGYLFPSLGKMLSKFPRENPFRCLVEVLQGLLEESFPGGMEEAGKQARGPSAEARLVQLEGTPEHGSCAPGREREVPFLG